jgi:hypothetical protein
VTTADALPEWLHLWKPGINSHQGTTKGNNNPACVEHGGKTGAFLLSRPFRQFTRYSALNEFKMQKTIT